MNLSISNIAWEREHEQHVFSILREAQIKVIDVAPTKYIENIGQVSDEIIQSVKQRINDAGFVMEGMQSLLFGTEGLNLFLSNDVQEQMLTHLEKICIIGNKLNARKLVFGSPRNRDKSAISAEKVLPHAKQFFSRLGDIAQTHQVVICLEPNPTCYNANFMVDSFETAEVVREIAHPHIKMQLDVGAMQINDEDPRKIIEHHQDLIGHIHISQPQLAPVNEHANYHKKVAESLYEFLPEMRVCIEMLTKGKDNERLRQIEESVAFVKKIYGKTP